MSLDQTNQKKATVVNDFFAQCDKCKYWLRLRPLDNGYRTIPLRNCIKIDFVAESESWVCQQCYDKLDSMCGVLRK